MPLLKRTFYFFLVSTILSVSYNAYASPYIENKRFGDWGGNCEDIKLKNNQTKKVCYIEQVVTSKKTKKVVMVTSVGYMPKRPHPVMIFGLPRGALVQQGVELRIDKNPPIGFKGVCDRKRCRAGFELDQKMLQQVRRGKRGVLFYLPHKGAKQAKAAPISFKGISLGINTLRRAR